MIHIDTYIHALTHTLRKYNDTTLQTTKLQEASHPPLCKTHYLSSFGALVMGAGWGDATANEADGNLGRTVMNGGVINQH